MKLIEIRDVNGAHCVQIIDRLSVVPQGWAIIPDNMETPNLPFGDITVEEIEGVPTVTSWTPREMPEVPETEEEPTTDELIDILLGVNENE